jgi:two-component system, OmpR family, heavy metal sensor histidine kinase CusS
MAARKPRRGTSVAMRMTLWFMLSNFALIFTAAGLLYWTLVNGLYKEDFRDLADNLNNALLLLGANSTLDSREFLASSRPSWVPAQQPQIYLRLLDARAHTIKETPGMANELQPPSPSELSSLGWPEGTRQEMVAASGKPYLVLLVRAPSGDPQDAPQFLQVAMDRVHDEQLLARFRTRLWLVFGGSLIGCSIAGYLIARGGMRSITRISQTAASIGSATLHERIESEGLPAELGYLTDTFNDMLNRLEQSFQHVSQFSDDVAHELRTPINKLRGMIEVALSKRRTGEAYRDVMESCLEECTRISRLIETLLFLARTDTAKESLMRERVDVGEELAKVEAFYGAAASEAGIALHLTSPPGLAAYLNRTLFQQAVGNLVQNSLAHTASGGVVTVTVGQEAGNLILTVTDSGCGIPPEHLPHVLKRFYRVDRARGSAGQNVGLGLAVVNTIATRHGGQVKIVSEVGRGTRVAVTFAHITESPQSPALGA